MQTAEHISRPFWLTVTLVIAVGLLTGCGSSDPDLPEGDDFSESPLQASIASSLGQIIYQWTPVADTSFYRLSVDTGDESGAVTLAEAVPLATEILDDQVVFIITPNNVAIDLDTATFMVESCVVNVDDLTEDPVCETLTLNNLEFVRNGLPIFQWLSVDDATFYRLSESPDGVADFIQLGGDIPADQTFYVYDIDIANFDWDNARFQLEACTVDECEVLGQQSLKGLSQFSVGVLGPTTSPVQPFFGASLALSKDGDTLAVGASGTSDFECREIAGYTSAQFEFLATLTQEVLDATNFNADCSYLIPDNPEGDPDNPDDDFVPPETLVEFISQAGGVYVYMRNGLGWGNVVRLEAPNREATDAFGRALALSEDGTTLAVGAPLESSASEGVGGNQDDSDNEALFSGAVYIYTRDDDQWNLQEYIKATNTNENDFFGWDVALSADGNLLVVGAVLEAGSGAGGDQSNNDTERAGAVYTYTRADGVWTPQSYIKASDVDAHDLFGASLSLSEDGAYLAVGAIEEGEPIPPEDQDGRFRVCNAGDGAGPGTVYVFRRDTDAWIETARINASNADIRDCFGFSLSMNADGSRLAVGAPMEDSLATGVNRFQSDSGQTNAGAAYLFHREGDDWVERTYLKASNSGIPDVFGAAVALNSSGDALAVGAPGEASPAFTLNGNQDFDTLPGSGAVYAFRLKNMGWEQVAYVKASVNRPSISFGWKLAIAKDGEELAVSAPGWEFFGYSGNVFLY